MKLEEKIYALRTAKNLSQGDLADLLEVSRQSVSKWETGASVPDLDKLVRLAEVFGVSLDELVLDRPPQPAAPAEQPAPVPASARRPGRTAGIALMCTAAVVFLLVTLLGGVLVGLLLALPFVLWGGICLTARKRPGLWCAWTAYALIGLYLNYATGTSWTTVLVTFQPWAGRMVTTLAVAWGILLCGLALLGATLWSFRGNRLAPSRRNMALAGAGWALWLVLLLVPLPLDVLSIWVYRPIARPIWDLVRLAALALLAERTAALLRARRSQERA